MREIKFRAWHEASKEMIPNCNQGWEGDVFNWLNEGQPITIMQYTGLKDKSGKEIYEGDIVGKTEIDKSYHKCVIRYSDRFAKFVFCPAVEEWDLDRCVVGNPFLRKEYEIIGNIYENKEFLEK